MIPPKIQTRPPALSLANQIDFQGGLNLTEDQLELGQNESPDMKNVDLDGQGGLRLRRAIRKRTNSGTVNASRNWIPFSDFVLGETSYFASSTTANGTAAPYAAVFSGMGSQNQAEHQSEAMGDYLYTSGGFTYRVNINTLASTLLTIPGGVWQDDYATPSGLYFPGAASICEHQGYMFAGNVRLNGPVTYANRLMWSHPGDAGSWRSFDYVNIGGGYDQIRGIHSMGDHLLILMYNSVYAMYGSSPDTWQIVLISKDVGTYVCQSTKTSHGVVFLDVKRGPHLWNGQGLDWIGEKLYPQWGTSLVITNGTYKAGVTFGEHKPDGIDSLYMWVKDSGNTMSTYVYQHENRSWRRYKWADDTKVIELARVGGGSDPTSRKILAFESNTTTTMDINQDNKQDDVAGSNVDIASYYTTGWITAGQPSIRKNWRRPEIVYRTADATVATTITVRKDYDQSTTAKTLTLTTTGTIDKNLRGTSIGTARAVQLKFNFPSGNRWSLSNLLLKYRTKPPRS